MLDLFLQMWRGLGITLFDLDEQDWGKHLPESSEYPIYRRTHRMSSVPLNPPLKVVVWGVLEGGEVCVNLIVHSCEVQEPGSCSISYPPTKIYLFRELICSFDLDIICLDSWVKNRPDFG